jgi:hypothetical protein
MRAKRYNSGKLRYELIPSHPQKLLAEVYTRGAHKYTVYRDEQGNEVSGKDIPFEDVASRKLTIIDDGADNWRKGQSWMESMGSVLRHIHSWIDGEDLDPELKTRHLANAAWGLYSLLEFERTHPELDNRKHKYLGRKKIGLDIDEVVADFTGGWIKHFGGERPHYWNYDRDMLPRLKALPKEFWMGLEPRIDPKGLPFEPACYITSRIIPTEWTIEWLDKHGFPAVPVHTIAHGESKVEVAKGLDIYVDDRFENFVELNNAGICCFLMDAPHNRRYEVGYKRIMSLAELVP